MDSNALAPCAETSSQPRPQAHEPSAQVILFHGRLLPGWRRAQALKALEQRTNRPPSELEDALFAVKPLILKRTATTEDTALWCGHFAEVGLEVEPRPASEATPDTAEIDFVFGHFAPLEKHLPQPTAQPLRNVRESRRTHGGHALYFDGELTGAFSQPEAIDNIAHLCKTSPENVRELLFSVLPVQIARYATRAAAEAHQSEYAAAGIRTRVEQATRSTPAQAELHIRTDKPQAKQRERTPLLFWPTVAAAGLVALIWIDWAPSATERYRELQSTAQRDVLVELRTPSATPPPQSPQSAPAAAPKATEAAAQAPRPQQAPLPQPIRPETPRVAQPTPPPPPRPPESRPKPVPRAASTDIAAAADQPTGGTGSSGGTDAPVPVSATPPVAAVERYDNQVRLHLARYQSGRPAPNQAADITLAVAIDQAGRVASVEVVRSSADSALDRRSLQDARAAAPYPAPPGSIRRLPHRVVIRILYRASRPS